MHKWTVMVYLAGDTRDVLSAEMIFALKEMKEADTAYANIGPMQQPVSLVVVFDPSAKGYPTERYVINKGKSLRLADDLDGTVNAATVKDAILELVRECKKNHEAENFMLVLSGHGSGPAGDCLFPDQSPSDALSLEGLHDLTAQIEVCLGKPLEILALSCCLANMIEVCHTLGEYSQKSGFEPHARYLIGPEGFEPLAGWPFREILGCLIDSISKNDATDKLAIRIVEQYRDYYREYDKAGLSADLAAIDLNKYGALAAQVTDLAQHLINIANGGKIQLAHLSTQAYLNYRYADLWDFCNWLQQYDKASKQLYKSVQAAVASAVLKYGFVGPRFAFSNGIGIYLPWTKTAPLYSGLRFAKSTHWDQFLDTYYESRRRKGKGGRGIAQMEEPTIAGVMGQGEVKPAPYLVVLPG